MNLPASDNISSNSCFHCGLPVSHDEQQSLSVFGEKREFCCHGCKAVCKTIVDSGLEDYYRTREGHSSTGKQDELQQLLDKLSIYDNQQVQKSFVQDGDDWQEAYLILEGIRCSACVWLNELHLRKQPGVIDVHIDEVTQRARVRWNPESIKLSEILVAITQIGYQAHPYEPSHYQQLQKENKRKNLQRLIYVGFVGMIPMHFAFATWFVGGPDQYGELENWEKLGRWTSLFVTLTILLYSAQEFYYGVWSDLRRRIIGMDVPIVLGLTSAFLLSAYSTVMGSGEVYFESISMFVLFVLISRRLEHQARIQASDQLERLALSQPLEANLILEDGSVKVVSVKELRTGQKIQILPGEQVPVDCKLIEGNSGFDESLMTGESKEVQHLVGDHLIAGSVNYHQPVIAQTTADEMGSTIMEITRLAEAGLQKKPIQTLIADKVASRFVVIILILASTTAIFWYSQGSELWLVHAISVLIVTCPCALALATPIALTISSSLALKNGLLPLNMSVINKLAKIDTFVFDKTGTLTQGIPRLVEQQWIDTSDPDQARSILMSMVNVSEHPMARSVRNQLNVNELEIGVVKNTVGQGLEVEYTGNNWRFGSLGFACPDYDAKHLGAYSVSCLSKDQQMIAIFLFEDQIRDGVVDILSELEALNIDSVMLSGDNQAGVNKIADKLGFKHFHSNMLPQKKMDWVANKQAQGHTVAMIGDGVNDAPTLACADVSFSLAESTNLANIHSDFILMGNDLSTLSQGVKLAQATIRKVRQNIGWAVLYNVIALPFAMAGLVAPWLAAVGMSISSIIVVYNSLRLNCSVLDLGQVSS